MRNLEGISHDKDRAQLRDDRAPERKSQAIAWVFPTPRRTRIELLYQKLGLGAQRLEAFIAEVFLNLWWQIPGAAQFIQQFVVQRHEPQMFPETIGVIGLRGHQLVFWAQIEAASMQ